ncbi:hypothetical protein BB560_001942 [Smittium megazygosporum]|uniref:Nascent polypeptide-associated complex subunit alpha n=1 Tax=Smittium megazygosporum TaxID=133381 RepID=A0A2T9ZG36_9FUNG|nr:hypothetical protein BB560_001942 [Smittium megazygosporum]
MSNAAESHDHSHDHSHEGHSHEGHSHPVNPPKIGSKMEKKARKALEKQGLDPVHGITRVTMKRPKGVIVSIQNPEVYKSSGSNTYIVFGEARVDDMAARMQQEALAKAQQNAAAKQTPSKPAITQEEIFSGAEQVEEASKQSDDEEVEPLEGTTEENIGVVMNQANVSRSKAIKALKEKNNDLVEAIMSLM